MATLGTLTRIQSNVIAYESLFEYGFCRKAASNLLDAQSSLGLKPLDNGGDNLELGSVVTDNGTAWVPVTQAEVTAGFTALAQPIAVVIGFGDQGEALKPANVVSSAPAAGDVSGLMIIKGVAILRKSYLLVDGNVEPTDANVLAAFIEDGMTLVNVDDSVAPFNGVADYTNY